MYTFSFTHLRVYTRHAIRTVTLGYFVLGLLSAESLSAQTGMWSASSAYVSQNLNGIPTNGSNYRTALLSSTTFPVGTTIYQLTFSNVTANIAGYSGITENWPSVGQKTGQVVGALGVNIKVSSSSSTLTGYVGFCGELAQNLHNGTVTNQYTVVDLESISSGTAGQSGTAAVNIPSGGIGASRAGMVRYLFDLYFKNEYLSGNWTNDQGYALQTAIREVTHEVYSSNTNFRILSTSPTLGPTSGGYYVKTGPSSGNGIALTEQYLTDINNKGWTNAQWAAYKSTKWHVVGLKSSTYQDLIVAEPLSAPLPVRLQSFTAAVKESAVQLSWATSFETSSDHFSIERSADAMMWSAIGSVSSKGESEVLTHYQFGDNIPLKGISYYRLKMVDLDGTYEYSKILSTTVLGESALVYPNPVADKASLGISDPGTIEKIELVSIQGKSISLKKGTSEIDLTGVASGIYLINVTLTNGNTLRQRIIKK